MTFRSLVAGLSMAVLAAGFAAPASAADFTTKWKNGFRVESEDGQFKLKFGGRIMLDYSFADADDAFGDVADGNEFRRTRLFFSGTLYDNVEFKANYDFAGGEADFKDVYVGLKGTPIGNIRIGHQHEQFSLNELTSSKYITFMERALPTIFAPSRNTGINISDKFGDRGVWAIGAFRESDDFGDTFEGDGKLNLTARVAFQPLYEDDGERMIHLGFAVSQKDLGDDQFRWRQRPEVHLSPRFVNTDRFDADSALLLGAEFAGVAGSFHWAAEYMQADHDAPAVGDPTFSGFYAQAGWFVTGESRAYKGGKWNRTKPNDNWSKDGGKGAWELAFRYSTLDLTDAGVAGGEIDDLTLGVNWYLNPAMRFMMNYINSDVDGVGDANFVTLRFQVDF